MQTTPSIYFSDKPRWRDLKLFIEDDVTEALLKGVKKAHKINFYLHNRGIHKASKELVIKKLVKQLEKLEDIQTAKSGANKINLYFKNGATSVVKFAHRKKFTKSDPLLEEIQEIKSLLLHGESNTKVGYIVFFVLRKRRNKKLLKNKLDKYIDGMKGSTTEVSVFDFRKYFKCFKRDDKTYKTKFQGYYSSVVLKIQLK